MVRATFPKTHRFAFELELEVTSVFGFSSGELGALVTDGLFVMDEMGLLFPGVSTPDVGNRLFWVKTAAIGYQRRSLATPGTEHYRKMIASKRRPGKTPQEFTDRLEWSAETLITALLHQRMLVAKLQGLASKSREPGAISDADRTIAEILIAAATAVEEVVTRTVSPAL